MSSAPFREAMKHRRARIRRQRECATPFFWYAARMRRLWGGTLSIALVLSCSSKRHDVVAEVTACEQQVPRDLNSGNLAAERALIADEFVGIDPDGSGYNKEQAIAGISDFKRSGRSIRSDGITVQDLGNVAVAHGFDHYFKPDGTPEKTATWTMLGYGVTARGGWSTRRTGGSHAKKSRASGR
jgi:hypothetical protein